GADVHARGGVGGDTSPRRRQNRPRYAPGAERGLAHQAPLGARPLPRRRRPAEWTPPTRAADTNCELGGCYTEREVRTTVRTEGQNGTPTLTGECAPGRGGVAERWGVAGPVRRGRCR